METVVAIAAAAGRYPLVPRLATRLYSTRLLSAAQYHHRRQRETSYQKAGCPLPARSSVSLQCEGVVQEGGGSQTGTRQGGIWLAAQKQPWAAAEGGRSVKGPPERGR